MKLINLKSKRLDFIEISKEGLEDMHEYSIKKELYSYLEFLPHESLADTRAYLDKLISRSSLDSGHYWFIKHTKQNKVIGTFGLHDIDWRKKIGEVSYGVSPSYSQKGIFTEALRCVLAYVFNELGFHRICATTRYDNLGSIKGLQKLGFKIEGKLRDFYLSHDGNRYDALILAIIKKDIQNQESL